MKRNQTPLPPPGFVRAEAQLGDQVGTAGLEYPLGLSQNLFSSRLCLRVIFPPLATCFRNSHVLKRSASLLLFLFFPIFQILLWDPKGAFAHPNFLICLLAIFKLADLIFAPKWVGTVGLGKQQTWWKTAAKTEFSPYQRGHCILPVLLLLMIPTKMLLLKCPNSRFPRLSQARIFCGVKGHYYLDRERD